MLANLLLAAVIFQDQGGEVGWDLVYHVATHGHTRQNCRRNSL